MKRIRIGWVILFIITTACTRPVYVYDSGSRHDNGLHKGWYKQGKKIPPGQAKKMGRY